jgi:hypothetical protein
VTITEDRQMVIWGPNDRGQRHAEHRTIGDSGYICHGDTVWVRQPRAVIDPVYVVCCVSCSRWDGIPEFSHRRARVVAESEYEIEATELAKFHAENHRLAGLSFDLQRIVAYKRQNRLERQLG